LSDRRLAGWTAQGLEAHLDELVATAKKWRDGKGERPVVTVHVTSGQRHVGYVLDVARSAVTLQGLPQGSTIDLDVTVIPIARIEALTLHAAQTQIAAVPPSDAATSMLDLRRRVKTLGDLLASRTGKSIAVELGTGELAQLAALFEYVKVALERVCGDELGRASLAERVQRIELRGGDNARVSLANGVLVFEGALASARLANELDALL